MKCDPSRDPRRDHSRACLAFTSGGDDGAIITCAKSCAPKMPSEPLPSLSLSLFYSDIWKKIFTRIFNRILWPAGDYGIVSRGGAAAFETRLCHDIVIFRYIQSIIKRRSRQLGQQTRLHPRLFHFRPQMHHNRQPGAARRWVCFAFKIISQKQMQNRRYGGIFIRFISRRYVKILGHRRKRLAGRFSRLSIDINKYYVKRSLAIIHW